MGHIIYKEQIERLISGRNGVPANAESLLDERMGFMVT
mgnify:CR=1 FL=1